MGPKEVPHYSTKLFPVWEVAMVLVSHIVSISWKGLSGIFDHNLVYYFHRSSFFYWCVCSSDKKAIQEFPWNTKTIIISTVDEVVTGMHKTTTLNVIVSVTCIWCHYVNFSDDISYELSVQILSWVIDEFFGWPKPCLLLSATCDEILSWMVGIWTKNHLLSNSNCNTVNL